MEVINLRMLYRLSDDSMLSVIDFCMDRGLIARTYVCPKCGKNMSLRPRPDVSDKFERVCRTKSAPAHHVKRTIRAGTWFANSRMLITDILLATYMLLNKMEHNTIARELNISTKTLIEWNGFLRKVFVGACLHMTEPIGGEGVIVEIDERKFGKRESNRRKRVDDKWVLGGLERGSNKCFFKVVEKKDKETLLNVLKVCVRPGTTVISDCWKSYDCLEDEGFRHLAVNHSLVFKGPETGGHMNSIQGAWSAIKRSLPSRAVSDRFDSYLAEYVWRRAHSDTDDLMGAMLEAVCVMYPPRTRDPPPGEVDED